MVGQPNYLKNKTQMRINEWSGLKMTSYSCNYKVRNLKVISAHVQYLSVAKKRRDANMTRAVTAPFNNMRTLKFEAQPTNAFFVTVNQMFGGSSQLPTTAEHCVVV